jgi:hypothetical protein
LASFVTDTETYLRDRIHFARIFGESEAFGLLGKEDYVFMEHIAETNGKHTFNVRVWKNVGSESTKLEGTFDPCAHPFVNLNFLADGLG